MLAAAGRSVLFILPSSLSLREHMSATSNERIVVIGATRTVAALLDGAKKPIIVYESTVYPGVTEDICGPLLEEGSRLQRGSDFFLGYSPERINPGDREHTVDRIVKVVAGENEAV